MRFSTLLVVGLLAACSGDEGVALEVTSQVDVDRIELFIATGQCHDSDRCTAGIGWSRDGQQMRPAGDLYYVLPDDEPIVSTTTDGATIVMRLQADADYAQPKAITIVGFKNDVPVAAHTLWYARIPQHTSERWQVTLQAADRVVAGDPAPATDGRLLRVDTFQGLNAMTPTRCLAMQNWDEGEKKWKSWFVVPESDPDCDGYTELECNAEVTDFRGTSRCVQDSLNQCQLGRQVCADGEPKTDACLSLAARPVCLASELCTKCGAASSFDDCAQAAISEMNSTVIHASCHFYPKSSLEPCGTNGDRVFVKLPTACTNAEIFELSADLKLAYDGTRKSADAGGATVTITDVSFDPGSGLCDIQLRWTMGAVSTFNYKENFVLAVLNPTSVKLLPIEINFSGAALDCVPSTFVEECAKTGGIEDDSLWQCGL